MSRAAAWVPPLVALLVLGLVTAQTLEALRVSGAYGWHTAAPRAAAPPAYQSLDEALARQDPGSPLADLRDPFAYAPVARDPAPARVRHPAPVAAVVPELPVVTAILWDNDPRALVRWRDRDWTVREGGSFDEFQVVGITRDQVTLRRGEETLVLKRRTSGE